MEVQSWSVSTVNLLTISTIFLGTSLILKKKQKELIGQFSMILLTSLPS